jgi:hypothetical protein
MLIKIESNQRPDLGAIAPDGCTAPLVTGKAGQWMCPTGPGGLPGP